MLVDLCLMAMKCKLKQVYAVSYYWLRRTEKHKDFLHVASAMHRIHGSRTMPIRVACGWRTYYHHHIYIYISCTVVPFMLGSFRLTLTRMRWSPPSTYFHLPFLYPYLQIIIDLWLYTVFFFIVKLVISKFIMFLCMWTHSSYTYGKLTRHPSTSFT